LSTTAAGALLEGVLRRDRAVAIACLLGAIGLSWGYLLSGAGMSMHDMGAMMSPGAAAWTADYVVVMLVMWAVMMVAMMLPSAAPMILFYGTITRRRKAHRARVASGMFAFAYVLVWVAFSAIAVALQFALDRSGLISPLMRLTSATIAGSVLIAAGLYQWTPLKHACLRGCRSPLEFVMAHWRDGVSGAFMMGTRHGLYCFGCCWALMLLLFVGGVMSFVWIAGLAAFVLVEKLAPGGQRIARAAGAVLVVFGAATLFLA
jgi:predicted metal-binding membrane protein